MAQYNFGSKTKLDFAASLGRLRFDLSTVSLIAANLVTIGVALSQGWRLSELMWIYWGQSCIIGVFTFLRILSLKQFSTEGVTVNGRPVDPTPATRRNTAWFFLCHYGFFHFVYCIFLAAELTAPTGWPLQFSVCLGTFLVNHAFSFAHNFERDRNRRPNIGTVMFFPYARIFPMHLMIVSGAFVAKSSFGVIVFLALKTLADLIMHAIEHGEAKLPVVSEANGQ